MKNLLAVFSRVFWTKRKIIWGVVILGAVSLVAANVFGKGAAPKVQTDTVKRGHLERTVLSTGQVVSSVDLDLSFQGSGIVRQVFAKEGMRVHAGQTLATLDQSSARATLLSAQGALAQAQANYDKVIAGASSEDVAVSKAAVAAAQVTLDNAYSALLNSGPVAVPANTNTSNGTITVSGTYTGSSDGKYVITSYGNTYNLAGIDADYTSIVRGVPLPLGTHGLFITFSATGSFNAGDSWTITIPNTQASTYLANYNAYQAAQSALAQAQASLALKQAAARPQDIESAKAQVLSAQGQVAAAEATLANTVLSAPSAGTITKVAVKAGEQTNALQQVMVLQDVGSLHAEADVSEADIAAISVGQSVDYTFDALGPDQHFSGKVQSVNPGATVVSGIVNYKVTANIVAAPQIKPGMTANMTVLVASKDNALSVPSSAILSKIGRKYVRVIDDPKKKTFHEVEVHTGLEADGGLVEVLSGLSEGQEVVIDIQK